MDEEVFRDMGPLHGDDIPSLYKEFEARHFRSASVVWISSGYWLTQGIDISAQSGRYKIVSWLLDNFALGVPATHDLPETFRSTGKTLFADRYGGARGAFHGGSGRSGTIGNYNAKGVGRTPLCSVRADWYHGHGFMWLEEAIREAIFSNLAWHEFPLGANPVVAVIDTGERVRWPDGTYGDQRAIIVRPAALRLAHLERSIYFGSAGKLSSDQYLDAKRVRETVAEVFGSARMGIASNQLSPDQRLGQIFDRFAAQIGYGQAHRLFHGDYLSSNLGLDGALLDFGAFRAVSDWRSQRWEETGIRFGSELGNLEPSVQAVMYQCNKYLPQRLRSKREDIVRSMKTRIRETLTAELGSVCRGLEGYDEADSRSASQMLVDEFDRQQQISVPLASQYKMENGEHWLYAGLIGKGSTEHRSKEQRLGERLCSMLRPRPAGGSTQSASLDAAYHRLTRWARPRRLARRELLQRLIFRLLRSLDEQSASSAKRTARITRLIDTMTSMLRRDFTELSDHEVIVAQSIEGFSSVFWCRDAGTGEKYARIEGISTEERMVTFGHSFNVEHLPPDSLYKCRNGGVGCRVPLVPAFDRFPLTLSVGSTKLVIPSLSVNFEHGCYAKKQ